MTAALKQAAQIKIQMNVVKGPHTGQSFLFYKTPLTLGRGPENDVVLVNDPLVSRNHAKIEMNQNVFEITNLSDKNVLFVDGDVVKKSVLVNDSVFQIGDCEFKFEFDNGQAVVAVPKPEAKVAPLKTNLPKTTAAVPAIKNGAVANPPRQQVPQPALAKGPAVYAQPQFQAAPAKNQPAKNNRIRFYLIIVIVLGIAGYYVTQNKVKPKTTKAKPVLKYEDEIAVSLKSTKEDDLRKKREEDRKAKNSPQIQRAEENFIKGMRDFQLGNYARAQEFFQVVLNLIPDHVLARRHLYLSKVRFDELVQAKLVLGESNYQKHNFSMCESLYKQVMDMLQGKNNDQKFQLAQRMAEKCQLAAEGIR